MLPKPPPRESPLGFLFLPPFRVQGFSVAGEATVLQIPELDLCFDMGACPRAALASPVVALTHGHMDHVGGLAYWCSQRRFQGMGTGTIVCDERIEPALRRMLTGYHELEQQRTPWEIIAAQPDQMIKIKNNTYLRAFHVEHTSPAMGYVVIERRTKLKEEYVGLPQDKLCELKDRGIEITRELHIPLVAYVGDTAPGPHLVREDVRTAKILITECTFFEPGHEERARIGMHLHVKELAEWVRVTQAEDVVIVHVSRRTHLGQARERLEALLGRERSERVHLLMDHRANRARYERQLEEAGVTP